MPDMNKLKARLVEKGMSVDALATRINVDKSTIYRWFTNESKMPVEAANAICRELGISKDAAAEIFFDN